MSYLILFFKTTATTEIYTYSHPLSLPDALPISSPKPTSVTSPSRGPRKTKWPPSRGIPSGRWTFFPKNSHRSCSPTRSEEHTSELQSLMRISYAVFRLTNKKVHTTQKRIIYRHILANIINPSISITHNQY